MRCVTIKKVLSSSYWKISGCSLGVFPAPAFVADFPPVAPEFHQRTHGVRLKTWAQLTKNLLTKSSTKRFREYIEDQRRKQFECKAIGQKTAPDCYCADRD